MYELLHWPPPVGVFIAILGLLGIVVPFIRDLGKMGKREKAIWTAVMFALLVLEIRSIYADRSAHDREQATARAEQLKHFKEVGDGITKAIDESQKQFEATMERSNSILGGVGESIKIANGGDSYPFIALGGTSSRLEMYLSVDGNHHLLDVAGSVADVDKLAAAVKAGQLGDRSKYSVGVGPYSILQRGSGTLAGVLLAGPDEGSDYRRFNIRLSARNGIFGELLRIKLTGPNQWVRALVVTASFYDSKEAIVCEKIDKGFPVKLLANDTDWTNYMKITRRHIGGFKSCR
jgi:hypothetical protein